MRRALAALPTTGLKNLAFHIKRGTPILSDTKGYLYYERGAG
jgi:hypothetical protein